MCILWKSKNIKSKIISVWMAKNKVIIMGHHSVNISEYYHSMIIITMISKFLSQNMPESIFVFLLYCDFWEMVFTLFKHVDSWPLDLCHRGHRSSVASVSPRSQAAMFHTPPLTQPLSSLISQTQSLHNLLIHHRDERKIEK